MKRLSILFACLLVGTVSFSQKHQDDVYLSRSAEKTTNNEDLPRFPIINGTKNPGIETVINFEGSIETKYNAAKRFLSSNKSQFVYSNGTRGQTGDVIFGVDRQNDVDAINDNLVQNAGIRSSNDDAHTLLAGLSFRYEGGYMSSVGVVVVTCDVDVAFRDGRYRIKLSNYNYTNYNKVKTRPQQIYGMKDQGPCSSKGSFSDLIQCEHQERVVNKMFDYVQEQSVEFIKDFEEKLNAASENNDW